MKDRAANGIFLFASPFVARVYRFIPALPENAITAERIAEHVAAQRERVYLALDQLRLCGMVREISHGHWIRKYESKVSRLRR